MADFQDMWKQAIAAGHTPQEVVQYINGIPGGANYLKQIQMTGWGRYLGMAGSEGLAGAMEFAGLPVTGYNAIAGVTGLPQTNFSPLRGTDYVGLTDNPQLAPMNEGERMLAAGARGVGAAAIPAAITGGLGAPAAAGLGAMSGGAGGMAEQGIREIAPNSPNWLAPAAGLAVGGALGLGVGIARSLTSPSTEKVVSNVISDLGGVSAEPGVVGTTLTDAGSAIQDEMNRYKPGALGLPIQKEKSFLNADPNTFARRLANDPTALEIINNQMPDLVDQLGAARLNLNAGSYWRNNREAAQTLVGDENFQKLDPLLSGGGPSYSAPSIHEGLGVATGGAILGGLAGHHFGIDPYITGEAGTLLALGGDILKRNAARAIVDPWIGWSAGMGATGAAAQPSQRPQLESSVVPPSPPM